MAVFAKIHFPNAGGGTVITGMLLMSAVVPVSAYANDFGGAYIGANLGLNSSSASGQPDRSQVYPGGKLGYRWNWDRVLVGAEGVVDWHHSGYTGRDAGLDARFGYIWDRWAPYVRLGLMGTNPGTRLHSGLGVEYGLSEHWSATADWTTDSKTAGPTTYKNTDLMIGLNFRFSAASFETSHAEDQAREQAADQAAKEKAEADRIAAEEEKARVAAASAPVAPPAPAAPPVPAVEPPTVEPPAAPRPTYDKLAAHENVVLGGTFAFAKSEFYPSAHPHLDQITQFLAAHGDATIIVTGYADEIGTEAANLKLSLERAKSVKAYLVKNAIDANRILVKGAGSKNPIATNKNAPGRAQNRRVEVILAAKAPE